MTDDLTAFNGREMDRLTIMGKLAEGRLSQRQAAQSLSVSERQVRRLYKAFRDQGACALVSKRRGKPSTNRLPEALRQYALELVRARYTDFGPTFAHEKLVELHDVRVSVETLRKWMIEDGIWKTRAERKKRVQQPRRRRDCYGELIQIDGSDHHWFEDRGPKTVLLVFVDDATSDLMELRMCRSESTFDYFWATRSYLGHHGKPVAFYSDKAGIFRVNAKEPKGGDGLTQFGRAMTDLNIDVICANTPAAKGRVERAHLTLQDRLTKELRLRDICTIEDANAYLPEFMQDYNRRFGRPARVEHDAHRPLLGDEQLDDIFCLQHTRKVTSNLTLHFKRVMYILEPTEDAKRAAKKRVTVYELEDGSVSIRYKGTELPARPFHKDRRVTQGAIVANKRLGAMLEHIKKRQEGQEERRLASARTKREKNLVAKKFAAWGSDAEVQDAPQATPPG